MKIQLERNLRSGGSKLRCKVCTEVYVGDRLRTLLCHDDGSIAGDICTNCLQLQTPQIQQHLHQRAVASIDRPTLKQVLSPQQEALELFELSRQPLDRPPFYAWWWERLKILTAETQELELVRLETPRCKSQRYGKPLKISFLSEEPAIGKDN